MKWLSATSRTFFVWSLYCSWKSVMFRPSMPDSGWASSPSLAQSAFSNPSGASTTLYS